MLPVLFRLGPLTIGTHDFFTVLGLAVGMALYYRSLRRSGALEQRIIVISLASAANRELLIPSFREELSHNAQDLGGLDGKRLRPRERRLLVHEARRLLDDRHRHPFTPAEDLLHADRHRSLPHA